MEEIKSLFKKYQQPWKKVERRTERGDLMDYFLSVLNPARRKDGYKPLNHKRLAFLLTGIPTKDLYALKSKMEDANIPPSAVFWTEIRPKKSA